MKCQISIISMQKEKQFGTRKAVSQEHNISVNILNEKYMRYNRA